MDLHGLLQEQLHIFLTCRYSIGLIIGVSSEMYRLTKNITTMLKTKFVRVNFNFGNKINLEYFEYTLNQMES
jgi:hypothetical protein